MLDEQDLKEIDKIVDKRCDEHGGIGCLPLLLLIVIYIIEVSKA